MGTVFKIGRLKFIIRTKDHKPAHVHVVGAGAEVKIDLTTFEIMKVRGFSELAAYQIVRLVRERAEELIEAWNEIHEE